MVRFLKAFRRNRSGMTSIEYAIIAGIMGTGVLVSLNYVADEMTAAFQPKGCTWDAPDPAAEDDHVACIGSEHWTPRRAQRPVNSRTVEAVE
ncbi:MAG: Flp family type IVb pilin [Pseudomonadota bacterium]